MYGWLVLRDRVGAGRRTPADMHTHLAEAAAWLARAQDGTDDDGVAASFDARRKHWVASYPETTGYIITTMYDYADFAAKPEYAERAERMARWETMIQLPEGGVRAGVMDAVKIVPTIFNTGQALFGWARAYEETRDQIFRESLSKAADWLVEAMDEDGAWRAFSSPFASHKINSYNTRSAYGLGRAYEVLLESRLLDAAVANVDWTVSRSMPNGWLPDNCLDNNDLPLTHTIAYSIRGILEIGSMAKRDDLLDRALMMARHVAKTQRRDGALPGRLNNEWKGAVNWTCVTGNAQMALNWLRLSHITGAADLVEPAKLANRYNMSVQDIRTRNLCLRGGIKGSHPIDGGYMTGRYPNWAAKFFMDALMLELGYPVDQCQGSRKVTAD